MQIFLYALLFSSQIPHRLREPLIKSSTERVSGAMRMIARRATKVPSCSLSTRSATTQAPHCAETRMGRLLRHGQRSLGCGSGSMSVPFYDVSCGSLRPFPLHARASPSPGRFSGDLLCRSACEGGHHSLRLASRISSRKASVAPSWDLIRGS